MKHRFRSGVYLVYFGPLKGYCHTVREVTANEIWIRPDGGGRVELDTALHEALHAERPEWSERTVAATATRLARFLVKLGYRRGRGRRLKAAAKRGRRKTSRSKRP